MERLGISLDEIGDLADVAHRADDAVAARQQLIAQLAAEPLLTPVMSHVRCDICGSPGIAAFVGAPTLLRPIVSPLAAATSSIARSR